MRIGLDVTPLSLPLTGIGVFVNQLAAAIAEDSEADLVPIALTGRSRREIEQHLPETVSLGRSYPARVLHTIWKHANVPTASHLVGPVDVVHGTNFYGIPTTSSTAELITIHDTGPWLRPHDVSPTVRTFPRLAERAVRRGAHVHTLTFAVGEEVRSLLDLPPNQVHPIQIGYDEPDPRPVIPRGLESLESQRFLLAVGTIEPRKRFGELVASIAPLLKSDDGLQLVIAGDGPGAADLRRTVSTLGPTAQQIHMPGWVSAREKSWLLRNATIVVSNAKSEGFGMVPLEAMAVATPVISTDGAVQREVCGDGAVYVAVDDPSALARETDALLGDTARAALMATNGRAQAARFTWSRCTHDMIELYRTLASSSSPS
ncbi:MAG: glycosyltransferase family 4 protein [Acidimicrobiales bacterium]